MTAIASSRPSGSKYPDGGFHKLVGGAFLGCPWNKVIIRLPPKGSSK